MRAAHDPENPRLPFEEVCIPGRLFLIPELDSDDRILLATIYRLTGPDWGCYASNHFFAGLLGMCEREVTRRVAKLCALGYAESETVARTRDAHPNPNAPATGGTVRYLYPTDKATALWQNNKAKKCRGSGLGSPGGSGLGSPLGSGPGSPARSGLGSPPPSDTPYISKSKSSSKRDCYQRQAGREESTAEAAESCNPPQPTCLPADSALTAPTGDERQAALVAFGATADEARAILCDDAALPLSRLQGWIAEYGVRTARGNAIARPIAWLRTCLRSGESAPVPPPAPAPAAEDLHGEWSMEKRIRMTAAIEQRDRREAEERTRAAHEAMQQMLARLDAARAARPVGAGDGALRP